jgi:hypothetical protein
MRKLLLIVLLLLGAVISVSAIGEAELSTLASYVPEDALIYAAVRTDDEFLRSVDALINKGLPFFPPETVPSEISIIELLDEQLDNVGLGSFNETIRPWLGATTAIALFASEESFQDPDVLVIVAADAAAAYDFFEPILGESDDFEAVEINNMQGFASTDEANPVTIVFGEEAVFIVNNPDRIPAGQADNALSDNEAFNDLLSKLPADDYTSIVYLNNAELQRMNMAQMGAELPEFAEDFLNLSGGLVLGFTSIDDALIMDIVQTVDYSAFEDYGVTMVNPSALDMSFTNHVPADAITLVQGSDFGAGVQTGFDNLRALGEYIKANGGLAELIDPNGIEFDTEEQRHAVNQFDLAWILGAVNVGFAGTTGLSLENDVLPVLDGDAAAYVRLLPAEDFMSPVIPDGAILFQSSNSEGAQAIVSQLTASAEAYETPVESEDYGNGIALVFPAEETLGMDFPALDLIVGASDDLIALGTRGAVEASLSTSGGLADDAIFQEASQYMLSDSQSLTYLATAPFFNVIDPVIEDGEIPMDDDTENAYRLLSLVESATISSVIQTDGTSMIRFVISLSDAPRSVPQSPDA